MAVEQTLILAKPDAVAARARRRDRRALRAPRLRLRAARLLQVDRALAEQHYAEHAREAVLRRARRVHHLGPDARVRARGRAAISTVRTTIGATNPADAAPGSIRGDLALAMPDNLVHGSDSPESARARDRALVPRRPCLSARLRRAQPRELDAGERGVHGRAGPRRVGQDGDHAGGCGAARRRGSACCPTSTGNDVVELGCGTAYFGAWLKRGAARRVVGVDVTPAQLETARRVDARVRARARAARRERGGHALPDASFDLAVSEYGASIWCDPYQWIPEAARLLRPGGELVFLRNSTLAMLCAPDDEARTTEQLHAPAARPAPARLAGRRPGGRVPARPRRLDPRSCATTASSCSISSSSSPPDDAPSTRTTRRRASGRSAGRARRSGARVSARERPAGAAAAARVDVAPAARDPRAAPHPVRRRRAASTRSTSPGADPAELVREHARGKARSVADGAGDRPVLGVDTEVVARRPRLRQAGRRRRGRGDARAARGPDARGRLGALPRSRRAGRSSSTR